MIRSLIRIGNSIGAIIPKQLLEILGWTKDTKLKYTMDGPTLKLTPTEQEKHLDLLFDFDTTQTEMTNASK